MRQLAHVLLLFTTTERPSFATVNATHFTFASRHLTASDRASAGCVREIDLAAAETLEAAARPGDSDRHPRLRIALLKPSAAAIAYGPTVLDPSALIEPVNGFP